MAVSILSPVSTQNLTPALLISLITSPTSSCNLSSMAVLPMSSKSYSISSHTCSIFVSLSSNAACASRYFLLHSLYASGSIVFSAINNVLKPSLANRSIYYIVARTSSSCPSCNLFTITESAPFVIIIISSVGERTITDILFLAEENSKMLRSSYFCISFVYLFLIKMLFYISLSSKIIPKCLAAFVRASSSGDDALNVIISSFFSATIV